MSNMESESSGCQQKTIDEDEIMFCFEVMCASQNPLSFIAIPLKSN
jgi:hypothetical protein